MENGNAPATKKDIERLEQQIEMLGSGPHQSMELLRLEMRERFAEMKQMIHDFKAEFLKLFAEYTRPSTPPPA
jgi:hypothetical protein